MLKKLNVESRKKEKRSGEGKTTDFIKKTVVWSIKNVFLQTHAV
jgi:hypothetical protein